MSIEYRVGSAQHLNPCLAGPSQAVPCLAPPCAASPGQAYIKALEATDFAERLNKLERMTNR